MAGEFVDQYGRRAKAHLHYSIEQGSGWWFPSPSQLLPGDPDFPAAAAALQSLLPKPTVHPAVGLRYCGEEEACAHSNAYWVTSVADTAGTHNTCRCPDCGSTFTIDTPFVWNGRRYQREHPDD